MLTITKKPVPKTEAERTYFTVAEVNQCLPAAERNFSRINQLHLLINELYHQLEEFGLAPDSESFDPTPDGLDSELLDSLTSLKVLLAEMHDQIDAIQALGGVVKDVSRGIVDWYSRKDGRDIYLCWRFGEKAITYWHEIDTGFDDRQVI